MNIVFSPVKNISYITKGCMNTTFCSRLHKDTFEHTIQPTINIHSISKQNIKDIVTKKNKIGRGYSHIAYDIPTQPDFVLRTPIDFDVNSLTHSSITQEECEDKNLRINIGQKVSEIKIIDNNTNTIYTLEVLKKQKGVPLGIEPLQVFEKTNENIQDYSSKKTKQKYANSIQTVANFPISAYEKLIDDLQTASKNNYYFDYFNSNNILYDKDTQSINMIDLEKGADVINYGAVLYALTDTDYAKTFHNIGYQVPSDEKNNTIKNVNTIVEKYMQAMKNKGLEQEIQSCMHEYFALFMGAMLG